MPGWLKLNYWLGKCHVIPWIWAPRNCISSISCGLTTRQLFPMFPNAFGCMIPCTINWFATIGSWRFPKSLLAYCGTYQGVELSIWIPLHLFGGGSMTSSPMKTTFPLDLRPKFYLPLPLAMVARRLVGWGEGVTLGFGVFWRFMGVERETWKKRSNCVISIWFACNKSGFGFPYWFGFDFFCNRLGFECHECPGLPRHRRVLL